MTESDAPEIYDAETTSTVFINNNHLDETLMSNIQDIKGKVTSKAFCLNPLLINALEIIDMLEHCLQVSPSDEVKEYIENLE